MSLLATIRPAPGRSDRRAMLLQHPLFASLGAPVIDRLLATAIVKKVKRGALIFRKGEQGSRLFGICSGTVKVCAASAGGHDAIFTVLGEGEILGEIALLDGGERTADAIALTDCELLVIERRDFVPIVLAYPEIVLRLLELLSSRLRRTTDQVQDVMFFDLPGRLAKTLLRLSDPGSATAPDTAARRQVKITQRELGQMIGMSRESTNKQLRAWESQNLVRLERGGVAVTDREALAAMVAGPGEDTRPGRAS